MPIELNNIGINLTSSKLQLVEIININDTFIVENIDEEFLEEVLDFGLKETKIINILQQSYDEILLRKPTIAKQISVTLPPNWFHSFDIPFEKDLHESDLNEHLKWEFETCLPDFKIDDFVLRKFELAKSNFRTSNNLIVLAVQKKALSTIFKFCAQNKLTLKNIDHAHFASNLFLRQVDNSEYSFSIYVSDHSFSLMLMNKNKPIFFRNFGLDNISQIVEKLSESINILRGFEVELTKFNNGYIIGDSIPDSLIGKLNTKYGFQLKRFNPFELLILKDKLLDDLELYAKHPNFTAAAGIALRLN